MTDSSYIIQPSSLGITDPNIITRSYCDSKCNESDTCDNSHNLSQEQTDNGKICCHYNSKDNACCSSGCVQRENMSTSAIVTLTGCNSDKGGRLVSLTSCKKRCGIDIPGYESNYIDRGPAFQQQITPTCGDIPNADPYSYETIMKCKQVDAKNIFQYCVYDTNEFKNATYKDIQNFKTYYCDMYANQDACGRNYDEIMTKWCAAQVSENCPNDPMSGKQPPKCARYVTRNSTNDADGYHCRDWIESKKDLTTKHKYLDAIGAIYCMEYNTNECLCVNRGTNKNYQETKSSGAMNDGCWWNPCVASANSQDFYFIPSEVDTRFNQTDMCPTNICASFMDVEGHNKTNVSHNKEYINCDQLS